MALRSLLSARPIMMSEFTDHFCVRSLDSAESCIHCGIPEDIMRHHLMNYRFPGWKEEEENMNEQYDSWKQHYERELPLDFICAVFEDLELPSVSFQPYGLNAKLRNLHVDEFIMEALEDFNIMDEFKKLLKTEAAEKLVDMMAAHYTLNNVNDIVAWQMEQKHD